MYSTKNIYCYQTIRMLSSFRNTLFVLVSIITVEILLLLCLFLFHYICVVLCRQLTHKMLNSIKKFRFLVLIFLIHDFKVHSLILLFFSSTLLYDCLEFLSHFSTFSYHEKNVNKLIYQRF